jgi:ubiquinone/menaquinone biosynthesis C-methylase UbiE
MSVTTSERDLQRFNRWSRTYEESYLQRIFFDRVHRSLLTLVAHRSEPKALLDVGCGTGRLLRAVGVRWPAAALYGVDPAEGMIRVARRSTPEATFQVGYAESIPLPDASVDVVLSTISFHHWRDHAAGVREVARVLQPGGYFFLTDMYYPAWFAPLIRHPRTLNIARVCAVFNEAGLQVIMQRSVLTRYILATVGQKGEG